ncbi:MAG: hypothetical protein WAL84_04695 [Candidatus Dormiibacterota bacterium]
MKRLLGERDRLRVGAVIALPACEFYIRGDELCARLLGFEQQQPSAMRSLEVGSPAI